MRPSAEEGRRLRGVRAVVAMATLGALALPVLAPAPPAAAATANNPSAVRFGGSGSSTPGKDRILIPVDPNNAVDVGGADFTIEFWMAGTPADNAGGSPGCGGGVGWINGRIIMDRDRVGSSGRDFGASLGTNGTLAFGVSANGGDGSALTLCTSGVNLLDGAWHHVALQRSTNGLMQIWVDGASRALANGPAGDASYPNGAGGSTYDPYLGFGAEKHDFGNEFPSYRGLFDEVRISATWRYGATFARPDRAVRARRIDGGDLPPRRHAGRAVLGRRPERHGRRRRDVLGQHATSPASTPTRRPGRAHRRRPRHRRLPATRCRSTRSRRAGWPTLATTPSPAPSLAARHRCRCGCGVCTGSPRAQPRRRSTSPP